MTKPIRVHGTDRTDEEVRARHADIEARLEAMGREQVQIKLFTGGLPTEWNPIAHAWLAGDKLEAEKESER
jgi:hypothetical protein